MKQLWTTTRRSGEVPSVGSSHQVGPMAGPFDHGLYAVVVFALIIWLGLAFTRTISSRLNHETVPLVRIFLNMIQMLAILNGLPFLSD